MRRPILETHTNSEIAELCKEHARLNQYAEDMIESSTSCVLKEDFNDHPSSLSGDEDVLGKKI